MRSTFLLAFVLSLALSGSASATCFSYPDFADTSGLTLNGDATSLSTAVGDTLRLAEPGAIGSAFTDEEVCINSFSTTFTTLIANPGGGIFDSSGEQGADGVTFTIQGAGPTALGINGGGLGTEGIVPAVSVELDIWHNGWDPDSNHVGINVDGTTVSLVTAAVPGNFDDGTFWTAWIDYDGVTLEVRVDPLGVRPVAPTLSAAVDIGGILGAETAHVGFTGSVGGAFADHDIVSWSYAGYCDCDADGFECGDDAGGTADAVFQGSLFTVTGAPGPAVLFDTAAPSCDDDDLVTPGYGVDNVADLGQVLIVQELGSDCVPDDEAEGGSLTFDFVRPIDFVSVGILDADEEGGSVTVIAPGSAPCVAAIPALDDNSWQEVSCELAGVTTVIVELAGSGAVTGFGCAETSPRPSMHVIGGEGTLESGSTIELDAYGHVTGWGAGDLRVATVLPTDRALLGSRVSRRTETLTVGEAAPTARRFRSSSRRASVAGGELLGRVQQVVVSEASSSPVLGSDARLVLRESTVLRGIGSWNGAGGHVFELRLDDRGVGVDRVRLTVWGPGGAMVAVIDESLVRGDLVLSEL